MTDLVKSVCELWEKLPREERACLNGPGYFTGKNVSSSITTYMSYSDFGKLPKRKRIIFGIPLIDSDTGILAGYSVSTLLRDAKTRKVENYFGKDKMSCVYLRGFVVDPDFRGDFYNDSNKYSDELLKRSLKLADDFGLEFICDIPSENFNMGRLLERNGVFEDGKWWAKNKILMRRMIR